MIFKNFNLLIKVKIYLKIPVPDDRRHKTPSQNKNNRKSKTLIIFYKNIILIELELYKRYYFH